MHEMLAESGYCGYINVNLIVNQQGIWPLEFTSHFGYPGFAMCGTLHIERGNKPLRRMFKKDSLLLPTKNGFAVGAVLRVPPFSHSQKYEGLSKVLPIFFDRNSQTRIAVRCIFQRLNMWDISL